MSTLDEAHAILDDWIRNSKVGTVHLYHAPNANEVGVIVERVIKIREMSKEHQIFFQQMEDAFDFDSLEVIKKNGHIDRIKYVKGIG